MTEIASADLYEEIMTSIGTLRDNAPVVNPDAYPEGEDAGHQCFWALSNLTDYAEEWQHRTARLADAVEQLHNETHGGPMTLCSQAPCAGLFTEMLDARKVARR